MTISVRFRTATRETLATKSPSQGTIIFLTDTGNPGLAIGDGTLGGKILGMSAYDIAVEHGFEGTEQEWLELNSWDGDIDRIDIANAEELGEDLDDDDLIVVNQYNAMVNNSSTLSRVWTYIRSKFEDCAGSVISNFRNGVETVSGQLSSASHSGKVLVTSGNIIIPNGAGDIGFNAVIIAGGAHTVTFNSTTAPLMGLGDIMTVIVQSTTVIQAVMTEATNKVVFS